MSERHKNAWVITLVLSALIGLLLVVLLFSGVSS